ncbi:ATP-binding cassette sub-family A member 17-like [Dermacentor variabilis]|uniref:ATP-binding cassette sub-family A member 17-like n=1 Tax=Dermacentor variabilis TaxID=34621 RepID=UPI003F5B049F
MTLLTAKSRCKVRVTFAWQIRVSYMCGEAMVPPTGGLNVAPGAKVHVARSGSVLWRGLLALQRYRLLHLGRHVGFYTLLLLIGALLFLVFCDRVASVRTPFPRALPRIPLDLGELRQGYMHNVTKTADLARAVIGPATAHRIKLVKAKHGVTDALSARNFTAHFAFELGTKALVSWYSVRTRRSEALSLLLLQNAALQYVSGDSAKRVEAAIEFLPGGASVSPVNVFTWLSDVELKLSGATFAPISLGLFSAAAALFPAADQASGGRLLQRLAGLPGALYWLSNMFWDYVVLYMVYMLLLSPLVFIWGFGDNVEFWVSVILMFAAYGWAAIPLAYVLSQLAGPRPSRAFSLAVVVKCVFGIQEMGRGNIQKKTLSYLHVMGVLAVLYLIRLHLSFYLSEEELLSRRVLELITTIARMLPTVSISWGLGRAMWLTSLNELCHMDNVADFMQVIAGAISCPRWLWPLSNDGHWYPACRILNATESPMHLVRRYWFLVRCCNVRLACVHNVQKCMLPHAQLLTWNPHSVWPEVASLLLAGLFCLAVLCFAETNVWRQLCRVCGYKPHLYVTRAPQCLLDEGEKQRLVRYFRDKTLPCVDTLVVNHLRQETGPYAPLHDVSLCMHRRECLALLGPTGSGRSLLLRVLTAQLPLSDGNAHLRGADLFTHPTEFVRALGYASEERNAVGWLTGRQLLRHVARMRRVPPQGVKVVTEQLLRMLDLVEQAERCVAVYSGGERAKLAVALALVGAPPVVLLDKPTEGLDPVSRRRVWHTIVTFIKKTHMSVLLATDDIEEAESVGSRVLFLHRGRARPMLSDDDLYPYCDRGYEITMSLDGLSGLTVPAAQQEVRDTVQNLFPGRNLAVTTLKSYVRFRVMDDSVNWEALVDALEGLRRSLGLSTCRVRATTVLQRAFYRRLVEAPSTPLPSLLMSPSAPMLGLAAARGAGELYAGPRPRSAYSSRYAYPVGKK